MSVCATCYQPGLPADGRHDCPGLGEIQVTRERGHGLRVDTAPARARMALNVLTDHGYGLAMVGDDQINIADQVLYQVVAYDPITAALVLELVEDWRPKCTPDATACTPIPAATLTQLSEVPPGLLSEQQRTRADNTEDQLRRTRIELEHWQTVTVPELRAERDKARTALREVLAAFATVTSPTSGVPMGYQAPPIHPDDMDRWRAALDQPIPAATQATVRDCLFGRDGGRPCRTANHCATCDPKGQPSG